MQLLLRRHRIPVAGPKVGAEHQNAARLQQIERGRSGFKAGETEEWRARRCGRPAVKRRFHRRDAAVDLFRRLTGFDPHQAAVRPGVMADSMALGGDPPHQSRVLGGRLSDQEERRAHAFLCQRRQDPRCRRRPRAVVEGQHHLVVLKRQGLRKALQSDARRLCGIDAKNTRGAERARARTLRRLRCRRADKRGNDGNS
jgi:hypothetical protein